MPNLFKYIAAKSNDIKQIILFSRKMKTIYKHLCKKNKIIDFNKKVLLKHLDLWKKFNVKLNSLSFKVFSSVYGKEDYLFVPEIIYYNQIEPILNNKMMVMAYADKNFYDLYYKDNKYFPKTFLRRIDGVYFNSEYNFLTNNRTDFNSLINDNKKIIIKKTFDTGGGIDIGLFQYKKSKFHDLVENKTYDLNEIEKLYKNNFIIQEYITQHKYFERFNQTSLNTVRIFTYRSIKNNNVIPLQAVLRVGQPGSIVDNQASGGISVGINQDGILNKFAVDKLGNKQPKIGNIDLNNSEKVILFEEMKEVAIKLAGKNIYARLLGFDFCVDENYNIRLIEINNSNNETNFFQMNNGPLFREYTEEIINYCLNQPRSFCFDFYL